jgi:hypothetical protein
MLPELEVLERFGDPSWTMGRAMATLMYKFGRLKSGSHVEVRLRSEMDGSSD